MIASSLNIKFGAFYDVADVAITEFKKNQLPPALAGRIILVDTTPPNSLTDQQINEIYNLTDIGINTSDGEGYGLCTLEHLSTGAPQVITDVGTYRDFIGEDAATFIRPFETVYFSGASPLGHSAPTFSFKDVAAAMNQAVLTLDKKREAIKKMQFKDWKTICRDWLDDLQEELGGKGNH